MIKVFHRADLINLVGTCGSLIALERSVNKMEVSQSIQNIIPYRPGKPIAETQRELGLSEVIKLASNENPLGASPMALDAIRNALEEAHFYPDATCYSLTQKVSDHFKLPPSWIGFGNGSNEILDLLIRVYCQPGDKIVTGHSSFIVYKLASQAIGVTTDEIPLLPDLRLNVDLLIKALKEDWTPQHKLVFLPNPNNPTGTYLTRDEVDRIIEVTRGREDLILIFDEAYNEFVRATDYPNTIDLLKAHSNIIIVRTMSKVYGLAGLRLGFVLAHPEVMDYYHRIRNPFNVNSLAQVAAMAALDDVDFLKASRELNWAGLDFFYAELAKLELNFTPSQGNFVLFDLGKDAQPVAQALLKKGIIVRPVGAYGLPNHLRISVGKMSENEKAMKALKEVLAD